MEEKKLKKEYEIGVIIGRFQIHELHDAHIDLFNTVFGNHKKVILFLGVSPALSTKRNPLDFPTRKAMIEEKFGNKLSAILPLFDNVSDIAWSNQIDNKIKEVFQIGSVVLYGSKDSFIPHYKGKFDVIELEPTSYISATDIRKNISKEIISSKEFREGIIYSIYNSYPVVHPTVDIAILDELEQNVLLARKPNEEKYRFVGGFADVGDESYEHTARREVSEETGLEISDPVYIGSRKVDDWRYRNEPSRGIKTLFFKAIKIYGSPNPQDDIEELKWFKINELTADQLVPEHDKLLEMLLKNLLWKKFLIK